MAKQLKFKGNVNISLAADSLDEIRKVQSARADNLLVNIDKELSLPLSVKTYKLIGFHENQLFNKATGLPYNPAFGSDDDIDVVPLPYVKGTHLNIKHTKGVFTKTLLPKCLGVTPDVVTMQLQKLRVGNSSLYSALTDFHADENALKKFVTDYKGYQLSEMDGYYIAAIEVVENRSSAPYYYEPIGVVKILQLTRRWGALAISAILYEMSRLKKEFTDDDGEIDASALDELFGTVTTSRSKLLSGIIIKFFNDPDSDLFDGKTKKRIVTTLSKVKFKPETPMTYDAINILGYLENARQPDQKVVDLLTDMFELETNECCFSPELKYKPERTYFSDTETFNDETADDKNKVKNNVKEDIEEDDDM